MTRTCSSASTRRRLTLRRVPARGQTACGHHARRMPSQKPGVQVYRNPPSQHVQCGGDRRRDGLLGLIIHHGECRPEDFMRRRISLKERSRQGHPACPKSNRHGDIVAGVPGPCDAETRGVAERTRADRSWRGRGGISPIPAGPAAAPDSTLSRSARLAGESLARRASGFSDSCIDSILGYTSSSRRFSI